MNLLKKLIFTFGIFFLAVAMYTSLQGFGFIDLTQISSYRFNELDSFTDKLRYFSSVLSNSAKDFSLPYISSNIYGSPSSTFWFKEIVDGLNFIVKSLIRFSSTLLLGGSMLFDLINDLVACVQYFYSFAFSSDKTGGFWSTIWNNW